MSRLSKSVKNNGQKRNLSQYFQKSCKTTKIKNLTTSQEWFTRTCSTSKGFEATWSSLWFLITGSTIWLVRFKGGFNLKQNRNCKQKIKQKHYWKLTCLFTLGGWWNGDGFLLMMSCISVIKSKFKSCRGLSKSLGLLLKLCDDRLETGGGSNFSYFNTFL